MLKKLIKVFKHNKQKIIFEILWKFEEMFETFQRKLQRNKKICTPKECLSFEEDYRENSG